MIGGGNVATDNCRSVRRLGAEVVDMVYRRTRQEMPAREDEVQGCLDEGINLRFLIAPKKIELNPDGDIEEGLLRDWEPDPHIGREAGFNKLERFHPIFIDPELRNDWSEVELGFDQAAAQFEAQSCLKCNLAAKLEDMVLPSPNPGSSSTKATWLPCPLG